MSKTPEAYVKDEVKQVLKALGAYYFMPVQSGYGATTLDFLACIPRLVTPEMVGQRVGLFTGIETKRLGAIVKGRQAFVMQEIGSAGGFAMAAWKGDDVREAFRCKT